MRPETRRRSPRGRITKTGAIIFTHRMIVENGIYKGKLKTVEQDF